VIRAVLDTNVLVSGFLGVASRRSTPGALMRLWYARAFDLVTSQPILEEFNQVMARPYFAARLSEELRQRDLALLNTEGTLVRVTVALSGVAPDSDDDVVLATAISGDADYVVTGDRRLEGVGTYLTVRIVSPRTFLTVLTDSTG